MEKTWRWFGKNDKITLGMLKQIGVEGIVTALHDVPNGEVWTREKIRDLREYIESYGMRWSVVESLPVSESIKYGGADRDQLIENYKESLKNLSLEGIHTICYNFMPRHLYPETRRGRQGLGCIWQTIESRHLR